MPKRKKQKRTYHRHCHEKTCVYKNNGLKNCITLSGEKFYLKDCPCLKCLIKATCSKSCQHNINFIKGYYEIHKKYHPYVLHGLRLV